MAALQRGRRVGLGGDAVALWVLRGMSSGRMSRLAASAADRVRRPTEGGPPAAAARWSSYGARVGGVAALIQRFSTALLPGTRSVAHGIMGAILVLILDPGAGSERLWAALMTDVGSVWSGPPQSSLFTHFLGQWAAFFSAQNQRQGLSRGIRRRDTCSRRGLPRFASSGFAALLSYLPPGLRELRSLRTSSGGWCYPLVRLRAARARSCTQA